MNTRQDFLEQVESSLINHTFVKLTLSKAPHKSENLQNLFIRPVLIKEETLYSFVYRYLTKDETKNYDLKSALTEISELLENYFKNATLCTQHQDYQLLTSKKGKVTIQKSAAKRTIEPLTHDKAKKKRAGTDADYLRLLGVTDDQGTVIPKMADKFRQINKFLEIIEGLINSSSLPKTPKIVDMGSGKGYLTFALYDYMKTKGYDVEITGIELRQDLVDFCNGAANQLGFNKLSFVKQPIQDYKNEDIDILIALHACDTATDDALSKGIAAQASLIVTAPCCHKQVRQQLKGKTITNPILKYGIFKERQYEMVTDTIRALILEREGYESKIFEFVSNEHTRKNVMLVGVNHRDKKNHASATQKIEDIKKEFGIDYQQLEKLLT
ncbi:SAM-dependent methyltransferase [Reichenbachiella agarivorans]|uniref:SAM-dependent methyltransferase n=1 Tax=Reichenbachiella agarivorans TaxID=2979464 RepID=A0ABY6CWU6_9BACT|nr:SAM-dependent methyltransferase [Reichenbachiella agarivorans]UXP32715.1 SAM-dependent methyltransferase [Reichenbachiella agarivorans]